MPWNRGDLEQWVSETIEGGRFRPNPSRVLLAIVHSGSMLAAMCPICLDTNIIVDSQFAPRFVETFQTATPLHAIEICIVRSPCSIHDDGQGGSLSPEESNLFDEHARRFARFASRVIILKTGTAGLQLQEVTRQKLLSSCEQLCAYSVDIAGSGKRISVVCGKDCQIGSTKDRMNVCIFLYLQDMN